MAKFCVFLFMALFSLASGAPADDESDPYTEPPMEAYGPVVDVGMEPNSFDFDIPEESGPGFYDYLDNCSEKLSDICGEAIFHAVFKGGEEFKEAAPPVNKYCCKKLILMGKQCHEDIVKTLSTVREFAKDSSEILETSRKVWDHCVSIKGAASLAPTT